MSGNLVRTSRCARKPSGHSDALPSLYLRILSYIRKHKLLYKTQYTSAQLCEDLGTSHRYINMAVKLCCGLTCAEMLTRLRMGRACRMLNAGNADCHNMEEIGMLCGFSSRQVFYPMFKRYLHITPLAFRKGREKRNGKYTLPQAQVYAGLVAAITYRKMCGHALSENDRNYLKQVDILVREAGCDISSETEECLKRITEACQRKAANPHQSSPDKTKKLQYAVSE